MTKYCVISVACHSYKSYVHNVNRKNCESLGKKHTISTDFSSAWMNKELSEFRHLLEKQFRVRPTLIGATATTFGTVIQKGKCWFVHKNQVSLITLCLDCHKQGGKIKFWVMHWIEDRWNIKFISIKCLSIQSFSSFKYNKQT